MRGAVGDLDTATLNGPRVSRDGRRVVVARTVQGNVDLWLLDCILMGRLTFNESGEQFPVWSPDGTRIVYESNPTGRADVCQKLASGVGDEELVFSSDQTSGQWQVSTSGGIAPVWRPDGKELYYLNPAGLMMAAPISVSGETLAPGLPLVLFPTRIVGSGSNVSASRQ